MGDGARGTPGVAIPLLEIKERRMKMDILERAREVIESDINYHNEKLMEIKKNEFTFRVLASLLQPEITKEYAHIEADKLEITFATIKRAREVVRKLLEETSINKFERTMEESFYSSKVAWHYKAKLDGITLFIGPASPDKKCNPVRREHKYHYWVCEKPES